MFSILVVYLSLESLFSSSPVPSGIKNFRYFLVVLILIDFVLHFLFVYGLILFLLFLQSHSFESHFFDIQRFDFIYLLCSSLAAQHSSPAHQHSSPAHQPSSSPAQHS